MIFLFVFLQQYTRNGIWICGYSRNYRGCCSLRGLSSAHARTRPCRGCWDHSNPNWPFGINNFYGQWRSWYSSQHDCLSSVFFVKKNKRRKKEKKPTLMRKFFGKFTQPIAWCVCVQACFFVFSLLLLLSCLKNIILFLLPLFIDLFCLL